MAVQFPGFKAHACILYRNYSNFGMLFRHEQDEPQKLSTPNMQNEFDFTVVPCWCECGLGVEISFIPTQKYMNEEWPVVMLDVERIGETFLFSSEKSA